MPYFAYISDQCREDAKTRGFVPELEKLATKIEGDQSIAAWDKFLPSPFVKKSLGSFRLIAEAHAFGDDVIICFSALMARGDPKYDQFLDSPHSFGGSVSAATLIGWLETRKTRPLPKMQSPTDNEYRYLFDSAHQDYGETIYETSEWVDRVSKLPSQAFSWLFNLLTDKVLVSRSATSTTAVNDSAAIAFCRDPEKNRTILIAPFFGRTSSSDSAACLERYPALKSAETSDLELRRISRRAYPALVAADVELWLQVENDTAANLALSPEEVEVLSSVVHESGATSLYPLFINGRPGSGKSTILQYLFAEHLALHLARPASDRVAPPLYLTYSERLLDVARRTVRAIISSNAQLRLLGIEISQPEVDSALGTSFALFHQFVRAKLPDSTFGAFEPERRVSFAEFKKLWTRKALTNARTRAMSPELAWHVLRTYIKGMRDDAGNYCDPDAYAELPAKRRSVSSDTFERVYQDVWKGWYGDYCASSGAWDDQDLTRAALDARGSDLAEYPVVFCDEAQDFTRIELELILRLALFSRRQLSAEELKRIPFAFAGDPFQTLNPTGFQWSSVQAGFHEQIIQELDPLGRARLNFNFQELSFNYRSAKGIVSLCNLIQAVRAILFDITTLRPQQTWFDETSPIPAVFRSDDPGVMKSLKDQEEIVIILPCQEGAEQEFIAADTQLQSIVSTGLTRNILSSAAAKGLEFTRVVLYKFGEECVRNYSHLLDPLETGNPHGDPETALPLMYFLNRLYVAASRPKRRLFIIDTADGIARFWQHPTLRDTGAILKRIPRGAAGGWQADHLGSTQPGAPESWTHDADDPNQLAVQFENQGLASRDPFFLSLAEANYKRAGHPDLAMRCAALRMEVEEDFRGAGTAYLGIGKPDDAVRCFWRGECFAEIFAIGSAAATPEARAARFMVQKTTPESAQALLQFLSDEVETDRRDRLLADQRWRRVLDRLTSALSDWVLRLEDPARTYAQLRQLGEAGLQIERSSGWAELAYAAGDYPAAASAWDRLTGPPIRNDHYREAKAAVTAYPERLEWLAVLGRLDEVAKLVTTQMSVPLTEQQARTALGALISTGRFEEALDFSERSDRALAMLESLIAAAGTNPGVRTILGRAGRALIRIAVRAEKWQLATEVPSRLERLGEATESLQRELVFQLAQSDGLTRGDEKRDVVALYLRGVFNTSQAWDSAFIRAVGAAVERAGRIVDALEYYEEIWKNKRIAATTERRDVIHKDALFAEQRWCKCKYRQYEFSKARGRTRDAEQQKAEADARILHLAVKINDLEEFPTIEMPRDIPTPQISVTLERMIRALALGQESFDPKQIADALKLPVDTVRYVIAQPVPHAEAVVSS